MKNMNNKQRDEITRETTKGMNRYAAEVSSPGVHLTHFTPAPSHENSRILTLHVP